MSFCLKKERDRSSYNVDISVESSDNSELDFYPIPIQGPLFSAERTRLIRTKKWRKRHDNCGVHSTLLYAMDLP
jgi:hypothetical protein